MKKKTEDKLIRLLIRLHILHSPSKDMLNYFKKMGPFYTPSKPPERHASLTQTKEEMTFTINHPTQAEVESMLRIFEEVSDYDSK